MYNNSYFREEFKTIKEVLPSKHGLDSFIMQCCKASEKDLRKFLKKVLTRSGFTLIEDDYKTNRSDTENVHNMLAIRGNPKVCLVSHTDVCRDHETKNSKKDWSNHSYSATPYSASNELPKPSNNPNAVAPPATIQSNKEDEAEEKRLDDWLSKKSVRVDIKTETKKEEPRTKAEPVMFYQENDKKEYRHIITDRGNKIQVGGDDRLGVAINTYIALNTGHDLGLLFTTDEEIGLKSADSCKMERLKDFELLAQTDRGNHSHQLVVKIGGVQLCDYLTACRLLSISHNMGIPRVPVNGMGTDVAAIKKNKMCKNACNMTVGYHRSVSSSPDEYIWVEEAYDTMRYVNEIVKSYQYEDLFE